MATLIKESSFIRADSSLLLRLYIEMIRKFLLRMLAIHKPAILEELPANENHKDGRHQELDMNWVESHVGHVNQNVPNTSCEGLVKFPYQFVNKLLL